MRIIQLLVTLNKGDAIGNFAISLHHALMKEGNNSEIYAYNIQNTIKENGILNIKQIIKPKQNDLIIYHMCEGHMINELIRTFECKKIAIYHNATPSSFFSQYGRNLYELQEKARRVISDMKDQFDLCIADSEYNKHDLIEMGYDKSKILVLPLIVPLHDYNKEHDYNTMMKYNDDFVNWLFVGRIVPNKKQEDIIRAFAYYHYYINNKSRLFIIGSKFINDYAERLESYIEYLELKDSVIIPGHSSFEEILSYYKCADIFLCMSEHEGFCVPLLEAMYFDVPIIAFNSTAIPYTMDGSGILVETKEPKMISEYANRLMTNLDYRKGIIDKQRERLSFFDCDSITSEYIHEINMVIGE